MSFGIATRSDTNNLAICSQNVAEELKYQSQKKEEQFCLNSKNKWLNSHAGS